MSSSASKTAMEYYSFNNVSFADAFHDTWHDSKVRKLWSVTHKHHHGSVYMFNDQTIYFTFKMLKIAKCQVIATFSFRGWKRNSTALQHSVVLSLPVRCRRFAQGVTGTERSLLQAMVCIRPQITTPVRARTPDCEYTQMLGCF